MDDPNLISRHAEKITCPVCGGKKSVHRQERSSCNKCEGVGWYEGVFGKVHTCKKCQGTGQVIDSFDEECLNCEGRGWVVRMILQTCAKCGRPAAECTCATVSLPGRPA